MNSYFKTKFLIVAIILIVILIILYFINNNNIYSKSNIGYELCKTCRKRSQYKELEAIVKNENCPYTLENSPNAKAYCEYHFKYNIRLGIYSLNIMYPESLRTARLYINTVKYIISNVFYSNYRGILDGSQWPPGGENQAITMAGIRRLDNVQFLLEEVIRQNIKGDFIEAGVWKGGLCVLATSIFQAYQQYDRKVFLADSYEGIPPVNVKEYPEDAHHVGSDKFSILSNQTIGGVDGVKKRLDLFFNIQPIRDKIGSEGVKVGITNTINDLESEFYPKLDYLVGYFKDSLPKAIKENKFSCFSVIRLDGDLYESTWQSLEALYPYLNVGGFVIIDDFTDWRGSFKATHDFRKKYNIKSPIIQVYHNNKKIPETIRGVYFIKDDGPVPVGC